MQPHAGAMPGLSPPPSLLSCRHPLLLACPPGPQHAVPSRQHSLLPGPGPLRGHRRLHSGSHAVSGALASVRGARPPGLPCPATLALPACAAAGAAWLPQLAGPQHSGGRGGCPSLIARPQHAHTTATPLLQIAVLKEMDGKGAFCSLAMAVVVVKDVLLFAAFAINVELARAVGGSADWRSAWRGAAA